MISAQSRFRVIARESRFPLYETDGLPGQGQVKARQWCATGPR